MTPFSLAQKGYYLFPVDHELRWNPKRKKYERIPLVKWRTECTLDPAKIGAWLGIWPNCWWGIDCGASGLFVIDDDRGKNANAEASLAALVEQHGPLPETFTVKTKSGGYHYYYRGEGRNSASGAFGLGIDTRATGGYVVAPCVPGYTALNPEAEVVDAPAWMLTLAGKPRVRDPRRDEDPGIELDTPDAIDRAKAYLERARVAVDGEGGGFRTIAVACRIRDFGISEEACLDLIYNSDWNRRCLPPWDDLNELAAKVRSAYLCAHDPIGSANPRKIFPPASLDGGYRAGDYVPPAEDPFAIDPPMPPGQPGAQSPRSSRFDDMADLITRDVKIEYLVEGLIETPTTGLIFGDPGTKKSFLAIDLACSVALGIPWLGYKTRRGPVFYFAGEGRAGAPRRVKAWLKHHGTSLPKGALRMSSTRIEMTAAAAASLIPEIQALSTEHGKPELLVIDTLARHMPSGADENRAADFAQFINAIDRIRDAFNCVAIVIHHSGKTNKDSSRGTSAIRGALDFEFKTDGESFECKKQKESEEAAPINFHLEEVQLGAGVSSAVVVCDGQGRRNDPLKKMSVTDRLALDALVMAVSEAGGGGVAREDWRAAVFAGMDQSLAKSSKSMRFKRAEEKLLEAGMIRVENGRIFAVENDSMS